MTVKLKTYAAMVAAIGCSGLVFAQDKPATPAPAKDAPAQAKPEQKPKKPGDLKDYKEVITAEAKTQTGLFKVHRIDDKVFWEIPANLLDRDMLWHVELAEVAPGGGFLEEYVGQELDSRLIRFSRRGNKLLVLQPSFDKRAAEGSDQETGINVSTKPLIIASLEIQTEGDGKAPVVEATPLLISPPGDLNFAPGLGAQALDGSRTFLDSTSAFPQNLETRITATFVGLGAQFARFFPGLFGGGPQSGTFVVQESLDLLPEKPMLGRYQDSRVGYFSTYFSLYGTPRNRVQAKAVIERYRLEKKNPELPVSDPVKPITFYVSREVPAKWRDCIRKSIEAWQPAFEQAGFSHAIIAKDAPTVAEDPNWNPEDARYSVIRWAPSPTENAMGPHIVDPRSGEVLSSHIIVWSNVLALCEDWYFAQSGANDPRASKLPLPDDLMQDLVKYVVTHEVGHTLGLMHNMRASNSYSVANLRDPNFVRENGVAASIMDYARFNFVSQPSDHAPQIGKIGPYDKFAIEWGYKPIPGVRTSEDEVSTLDTWAARQVSDKKLRWAGDMAAFTGIDPQAQTEDLSDDEVESTRLGILNLRRIAKNLISASTHYGEDYSTLKDAYSALLDQYLTEILHVPIQIGGVEETDYHVGRGGDVYKPVSAARQRQAVKFLLSNLTLPAEMKDPAILNKIVNRGSARIDSLLAQITLETLTSDFRLGLVQENEIRNGAQAYTLKEMFSDIQSGIWGKLDTSAPSASYTDRVVQNAYLDTMDMKLNRLGAAADFRPYTILSLETLSNKLSAAIPRTSDPIARAHFDDCRVRIARILEAKTRWASQTSFGGYFSMFLNKNAHKLQGSCWTTPARALMEEFLKDPDAFERNYGPAAAAGPEKANR